MTENINDYEDDSISREKEIEFDEMLDAKDSALDKKLLSQEIWKIELAESTFIKK